MFFITRIPCNTMTEGHALLPRHVRTPYELVALRGRIAADINAGRQAPIPLPPTPVTSTVFPAPVRWNPRYDLYLADAAMKRLPYQINRRIGTVVYPSSSSDLRRHERQLGLDDTVVVRRR